MTTSDASSREQIVDALSAHRAEIRSFGVLSLHLFGSTARDTRAESSDVDILVTFDGPATFDRYMDLKLFLEDLIGRKVDLVTSKSVKPSVRARIAPDLIDVA